MGKLMSKIADAMDKSKSLALSFGYAVGGYSVTTSDIIRCLEDPDQNPNTCQIFKNFYTENNPDKPGLEKDEVEYYKQIKEELDTLLGDIKSQILNPENRNSNDKIEKICNNLNDITIGLDIRTNRTAKGSLEQLDELTINAVNISVKTEKE